MDAACSSRFAVRARLSVGGRHARDRSSFGRRSRCGERPLTGAAGLIGQRALIGLAVASGLLAGVLYYAGAQRSPVIVAARDLDATHPLTADVLAVPVGGRAPAGRATELLAQAAIVLDVRADTGAPYGGSIAKSPTTYATDRIGSVVIAIDAADEIKFADRIATSTFILTLVGSR